MHAEHRRAGSGACQERGDECLQEGRLRLGYSHGYSLRQPHVTSCIICLRCVRQEADHTTAHAAGRAAVGTVTLWGQHVGKAIGKVVVLLQSAWPACASTCRI